MDEVMDHCRPLKDYEQRRQNFTLYLMIFLTISFWGRVDGTYIFQIEIKQKCSAKTIIIQGGFFLLVRLIFSAKMKNYGQPIRDSVPWNSQCTKDPCWLNNIFRCASISWFQVVTQWVSYFFLQLAHLRVFQIYHDMNRRYIHSQILPWQKQK